MSILIKWMQMPKNCAECPVALSGKYCRINQTYTTYRELPVRPDHCPLVELPERHGRLIDADYLKEHADEWLSVYNLIDSTPTIIEAEGVFDNEQYRDNEYRKYLS